MALVLPLMDFSGPEFNVSLTYFLLVCVLSQFPLSSHEVMYVTSPPKCLLHDPESENSAFRYVPRDQEERN